MRKWGNEGMREWPFGRNTKKAAQAKARQAAKRVAGAEALLPEGEALPVGREAHCRKRHFGIVSEE